jgi:hypothetical protein
MGIIPNYLMMLLGHKEKDDMMHKIKDGTKYMRMEGRR